MCLFLSVFGFVVLPRSEEWHDEVCYWGGETVLGGIFVRLDSGQRTVSRESAAACAGLALVSSGWFDGMVGGAVQPTPVCTYIYPQQ